MAELKSILSGRVSNWMGHTIATISLPRRYCQTNSENPRVGFCLSTGRCTGASSTRHRRFPGAKGAWLRFSNTVVAKFTESEPRRLYSIWSVGLMQEKVYRSRVANVNELEMRLIDGWGRFDQSIVDAAIAASGAVVSALDVSVERSTLWSPSKSFSYFVMYLLKFIKLMKIGHSSDRIYSQFS